MNLADKSRGVKRFPPFFHFLFSFYILQGSKINLQVLTGPSNNSATILDLLYAHNINC